MGKVIGRITAVGKEGGKEGWRHQKRKKTDGRTFEVVRSLKREFKDGFTGSDIRKQIKSKYCERRVILRFVL